MTKLSILILNYNTKDLTVSCVKSVIKQYEKQIKNGEFELMVIDNASTDGSLEAIEKISNIKTVKNKENYGFSKGNNIGGAIALGKYILFLNSDTKIMDRGFLKMIDFMEDNPKVGILGAKLLNTDGTVQPSSEKFYNLMNLVIVLLGGERAGLVRKNPKNLSRVDAISGASMMIRREVFDKLKGFDENLFMYMEDMELCFRARKIGFLTYFFPDIKLIHKELGSGNRTFAINQIYKGILYFYKRHKPYWQYFIVKILLVMKAVIALLIGNLTNNSYLKKTYIGALKLAL